MMKTYSEVIDFLYNQLPVFQNAGPGAYKPGLDTARELDAAFGHPHLKFRTVHVAGTNGKGSTSHTIASVLQAQGLKTGLYTSPHLVDFRERIRINGEMISEREVVDFTERYLASGLNCRPSFFELTTIMAFDHFARHNVDIAIIEVGLGGRLDTTNIITPLLSIITNISLDHTALLGGTEEEIAAEKAGIIKPGVPVVIGEASGSVREVFERVAGDKGCEILFAEDEQIGRKGNMYSIAPDGEPSVTYSLTGEYQHANANTVMAALRTLRHMIPVSDEAITEGFGSVQESTGLAGRWQTVMTDPVRVICDTGHNIGAWRILGPALEAVAKQSRLRVVMGFVNDKDVTHIFGHLPAGARYYFVTPSVARGRQASELSALAAGMGFRQTAAYGTVAEGFRQAMADSAREDVIFVGGSTFVVADFLKAVKSRELRV